MSRQKRVRENCASGQMDQLRQSVQGIAPMAQGEDDVADPGDPIQPDTTLRLQGGEELQVHGFLLRLASPVLRIALSAPKVQGRWHLELQDDSLSAWKLLYQAISPDTEDLFLKGPLCDMPCVDKLNHLRQLLGLAHKYGIERVVQQTCNFMSAQLGHELVRLEIAARSIDRPLVRSALLLLDTLLRFGLQAEYESIYDSLMTSGCVQKADLVDTVDRLQRESPRVLLHSQLVTDFLVRFVERHRDRPATGPRPAGRAPVVPRDAAADDSMSLSSLVTDNEDIDDSEDGSGDGLALLSDDDSQDHGGLGDQDAPADGWAMATDSSDSEDDDEDSDDSEESSDETEDDDDDEEN